MELTDSLVPGLASWLKSMAMHKPSQGWVGRAAGMYESVIPNPRLKLLDPVREVLRIFVRSLQTAEQRNR